MMRLVAKFEAKFKADPVFRARLAFAATLHAGVVCGWTLRIIVEKLI